MSLAVAVFFNDPAAICIHDDELKWAVYVWGLLDILEVATMKRQALVNICQTIRETTPWPNVRKTISWKPRDRRRITMDLDELDIANRKLQLLSAFYEHKQQRKFMSKAAIARVGNYNAVGPLMLRIYGPGGVAVPAWPALEVDLDEVADVEVPETGVQDLEASGVRDLVEVARDCESDGASADSDAEGDQQAAARVEAARIARAARLSRLQEDIRPNMSLAQIAILTREELETDKAEEETRQRPELDMAKPVCPVDNDFKGDEASIDAGSMIDQISSQLRANALWN
jgi:hypothetical protein